MQQGKWMEGSTCMKGPQGKQGEGANTKGDVGSYRGKLAALGGVEQGGGSLAGW